MPINLLLADRRDALQRRPTQPELTALHEDMAYTPAFRDVIEVPARECHAKNKIWFFEYLAISDDGEFRLISRMGYSGSATATRFRAILLPKIQMAVRVTGQAIDDGSLGRSSIRIHRSMSAHIFADQRTPKWTPEELKWYVLIKLN